jgi:hypothetical protein
MRQLQWGGKFITKVRAGLSVEVAGLFAGRRVRLGRNADEVSASSDCFFKENIVENYLSKC